MAKNKKAMKTAANAASGQPSVWSSAAAETGKNAAATVHDPPIKPAGHKPSTTTTTAEVSASVFHGFISDLEASPSFVAKYNVENVIDPRPKAKQPAIEPTTENTGKKTVSFAGLFSTNRKLTDDHKLTKFAVDDGPLTLGSDDLFDVRAKLGYCLVGYIAGKFPGLKAIRTLSHSWGATFQQHGSGWLIFHFAREEDRQRILVGGPYFVYGRPLLLKHMPDCFEFKEDDISLTPVWAILPSLPLECWHPNALGKIGSRIGNPIAMDSLTMKMERISYARIMVEVDASKKLIDEVEFVMPNGITRKQPVVYEFTPKFCTACNRFGHLQETCQGLPAVVPAVVHATTTPAAQAKPVEATKMKHAEWTVVQRKNKGKATVTATKPVVEVQQPSSPPADKVEQGRLTMKAPQPTNPKQAVVPSPADSESSPTDSSTSTQYKMAGRTTETKLAASSIPKILSRTFPGWCQTNNFDTIAGGRILVVWDPAVIDLHLVDISPQVIHCRATNKSSQLSFYISFTYGLYSVVNRRSMWEKLSDLGQGPSMPWLIMGDFNCVKSLEEKQLGVAPTWYELKDFVDCCIALGLLDVPTTGCYYTW
ncbi:UNVERIFIED_CONTAM: hypothetical protein Sindi_2438600 [Sesamum indicum]